MITTASESKQPTFFDQVEVDVLAGMKKPAVSYWLAVLVAAGCFGIGLACWAWQIFSGMHASGKNNPVGWYLYITDFVFWVGIAHSGTLISAILFLFRAKFRKAFNRSAEAMTVIAVMTAGLFPLIHLGRVWLFYWLMPYPNQRLLWVNFRSPLVWDVFAVSTYLTVSAIFFFVGMIPDLAIARRHVTGPRAWLYRVLSLGWRGTGHQWVNYERLYTFLAGFATPLVISVHSVVSWDFAMSVIPGWHTTVFAPYFVAGAIFSGFAMVLTILIPARQLFGLENLITPKHIDNMTKVILATGCMVGYAYGVEFFIAMYSGNPFESFVFKNRAGGPYAWAYWTMVTCNVITPQLFWFKWFRRSPWAVFVLCIFVNIGMWFERFVIIVTSLHRDFLPSAWGYFTPTWVDILTFVGSIMLFLHLFLLFIRFLPMIAMSEVKGIMHGHSLMQADQPMDTTGRTEE